MTIDFPSVEMILVAVLAGIAGYIYKDYKEFEEISNAFEEGYEKGVNAVVQAIAEQTGQVLDVQITDKPERD
jgi:hypothetical protein